MNAVVDGVEITPEMLEKVHVYPNFRTVDPVRDFKLLVDGLPFRRSLKALQFFQRVHGVHLKAVFVEGTAADERLWMGTRTIDLTKRTLVFYFTNGGILYQKNGHASIENSRLITSKDWLET